MRRQKPNAYPVVRGIKSEQKKMVVILILLILAPTILIVPVKPLQGISNEMNVEYPRDSNLNGYQTAFGENWLSGWSYRKSYTIEKTLGAGINYTIPIVVYSGIGADTGNTVYLNSESRMDLGDVRFTGEDGEELLSFWLEDYIRSYSSDYFADDCKYFSVSPNHYPHAYYYNGRTYVVWHGEGENDDDAGNPFIRYYDHSTRYWSTSVQIGTNQLLDDFHGSPNVWVDDEGYIHSLFGSHAGLIPLQHAKSNEPESISDGFTITELDWRATYPSVFYDSSNDVTHLWYRYYNGAGQFDWRYVNSSDNGITWNTQHIFIDVDDGTGYIPYRYGSTGLDPYSKDRIHMSWSVYDEADPHEYENVYYAYLNLIDMHAYNVEGIDLGTTIDVNEMQNYCLVLDTNNHGACAGSVHTDSKGIPYIMFASEYNDGSGHQYFTYWNSSSSSWVTPEQVCNVNRYSSVPDFIVYDSNNITAFLTQGEDLTRWTWDGSNWMKVEIIKSATSSRDVSFGFPVAPYGTYPQEDLQITFCEWYNAYDNKAFAWGSQGIVSDYSLQGAIFWVRLSGNLSENSQTIYIYYGNQAASSTSNGFETFPLFDDFNRPSSTIVDGTWTEDEGNGILSIEMNQLKIIQEQNEYCHIEQSSPLQSTLVLRGKMKSGDNTGVNWSPALAIYWNSYDWIKIGMNDYAGEFMTLMNVDSVILSNSSGGALSGSWYYYRIRVGIDVVCAEYSTDGLNWNLLTQISRPVVWIGYPSLIILGKGYAEDSDTFPGSNLDNSLSTPGFLGSHYIDDVFVRKYVDSDPVYGYWGGDENPNITQYSDTYIAGFRETLPDDIMFRPDDETYGEGYVESFTDISDWTVHTGNPLTSDGDVGRNNPIFFNHGRSIYRGSIPWQPVFPPWNHMGIQI
ncbi:MAG: DUF2341 domain-containing protein [Candidatus Thorarchaeota archaeon SMTZ1-45]|nr:MAG: hypothetical protein AM325_17020 [Candidatus Thorarchaeota archaeon SMTZ1-45]